MNKLTYYSMLSAIARISTWNEVSMDMINNSSFSSWDNRINDLMKENRTIINGMRSHSIMDNGAQLEIFDRNSKLIEKLRLDKEVEFTYNMGLISKGAFYGNIIPFILMGSVILSMFISIPLTYVCLGIWIAVQVYAILFCVRKQEYSIL